MRMTDASVVYRLTNNRRRGCIDVGCLSDFESHHLASQTQGREG